MEKFCTGTNGGWEKYPAPLLGGQYGTCFDISMLEENGEIIMYFSWRDCDSIARVTSTDGIHWSEPTICLTPRETPLGWEDAINRPYVLHLNDTYHMWYTGQFKPGAADGSSHIFYAISKDGITFERVSEEPVLSPEFAWEKCALMCPSVLWNEEEKTFMMWYSGGEQYEPNAFGYAVSKDGVHWEKYSQDPIFTADPNNEWEQHKVGGCQVIYEDGWYRMFYIGYHNEHYAQIGMARSKNGITEWERSSQNPIIAPDWGKWDGEACYKPFALKFNGAWWLWYNGRLGSHEQIGLAIQRGEELGF